MNKTLKVTPPPKKKQSNIYLANNEIQTIDTKHSKIKTQTFLQKWAQKTPHNIYIYDQHIKNYSMSLVIRKINTEIKF